MGDCGGDTAGDIEDDRGDLNSHRPTRRKQVGHDAMPEIEWSASPCQPRMARVSARVLMVG